MRVIKIIIASDPWPEDMNVREKLLKKKSPPKPKSKKVNKKLWAFAMQCCKPNPGDRPNAEQLVIKMDLLYHNFNDHGE